MPGKGPPPKLNPLGHGRQNRTVRYLRADDVVRGPELPPHGPDGLGWHPRTRQWWRAWQTSAQAQLFWPTDWSELLDCAALHSVIWRGRCELAAEVRLREAKLGATPEDRTRLRITVEGGSP